MNRMLMIGGSMVVAVGLMAGAYAWGGRDAGASTLLDGPAFAAQYAATPGAVLVDVRTPAEYAGGAMPGALLADYTDPSFASAVAKLDPSKPHFIYCRSGNRSSHAAEIMREAGIAQIYELRGGLASWPHLAAQH